MALNTTTGKGAQTTTGTPQNVGEPGTNAAPAGNVQPGTATNLLNSSSGIALHSTPLTKVDLAATTTSTQAATTPPEKTHHINMVALGICAVAAIVAVLVFVSMSRSAKNTT